MSAEVIVTDWIGGGRYKKVSAPSGVTGRSSFVLQTESAPSRQVLFNVILVKKRLQVEVSAICLNTVQSE